MRARRPGDRSAALRLRPRWEVVEARVLLANFLVTSTSDTPVAGYLTLRQAITEANANPGPNTIGFALAALNTPGIDDFVANFQDWHIQVDSPLPAITNQVSIDGYTQRVLTGEPAANETAAVSISGASGGTFTLTVGQETTAPIPADATADQIDAALDALPSIGANNVSTTVTTTASGTAGISESITIVFVNGLGLREVGDVSIDPSGLTGIGGVPPAVLAGVTQVANTGDITSDQNALAVGFSGKVRIILDGGVTNASGQTVPSSFAGLTIDSNHDEIRGLAIDGFGTGIVIDPNVVGTLVQGDVIGEYLAYLNPTFMDSTPIVSGIGNAGAGVLISGVVGDATSNNSIGSVSPETHNAIAGNGAQGVLIDQGADGNEVVGDLIGVLEDSPTLYYQVGNGAEGVLVESASNEIGGDAAGSTDVISDNQTYGVHILGPAAVHNRVESDYIGTDINGEFVFGQGNPGNGQDSQRTTGNMRDGIFIDNAGANQIGLPNQAGANIIAENFGAGIRISGASATGNLLEGNTIGLNLGGTTALPNSEEGIVLASADNTVGGSDSGDGNLISGNLRGILVTGVAAAGNLILGNTIGTDATGTYDLGNAEEGVKIEQGATGTVVGGLIAGERNLISGNNVGVLIIGPTTSGNSVVGNLIGTDATGTLDLGNSREGVRIDGAPSNTVGGSASGSGNVISANDWGVTISGATAKGNVLQGNAIGTASDGVSPLGNEVDGVLFTEGASNNIVGGLGTGQGNTIRYSKQAGVLIDSTGGPSNAILSTGIYGNGGPAIANASSTSIPSPPTLTSVASTSNGVLISGTYSGLADTTYVIQLFYSDAASSTGAGEGEYFLGTTSVTTNASGTAMFTDSIPVVVSAGKPVTATATDTSGNTSVFSGPIVEVVGSLSFSTDSYTVSEGAGVATITVDRVGGSGGYASVTYKVHNGTAMLGIDPAPDSNFAAPPDTTLDPSQPPQYYTGTLVFDTGVDSATFSIPLLDAGVAGPTLNVNLSLLAPMGAATLGAQSTAILNIRNDNLPGAFRFDMPTYVVNEAQGSITVNVVRDTPGIAVSVNYATSGGSATPGVRYVPVSGTLNFPAGAISESFTIPINDDSILEGDQTVGLVLSDPTNGATLGSPSTAVLTIQDDTRDRTGPTVQSVQLIKNQNGGTTALAIAFSKPLNPATATNLLNYGYSVRTAGRDHKFGTKDDVLIPINSATYDPTTDTVTLSLGRVIHPPTPFMLTINGSTSVPGVGVGVSDLNGNLLDGADNGGAGTPFTVVLSGKTGGYGAAPSTVSASVKAKKAPHAKSAVHTAAIAEKSSPARHDRPRS